MNGWLRQADFWGEDLRVSILLSLLNLGRRRREHFTIAENKKKHPEYWTEACQTVLMRTVSGIKEAISVLRALPELRPSDAHTIEGEERNEREKMLVTINKDLERCIIRPLLELNVSGQDVQVTDALGPGLSNPIEVLAMLGVRELLQTGQFGSLRRCGSESCKAWFVARRSDQQWCSPACKQRAFQSSEEFKRKRRATYQAKKTLKDAKRKNGVRNAKATK